MKLYKVTLRANEREGLESITRKGSHQSQEVINALILVELRRGRVQRSSNPWRRRGEYLADQHAQG